MEEKITAELRDLPYRGINQASEYLKDSLSFLALGEGKYEHRKREN